MCSEPFYYGWSALAKTGWLKSDHASSNPAILPGACGSPLAMTIWSYSILLSFVKITAFSFGKYYLTPTPSDLAVYIFTAREAAIP